MTNDDIELALLLEQNKDNIRFAKTLVLDDTVLKLGSNELTAGQAETLRGFVSVKDFGAVGDGVADDTAAIQSAIDNRGGVCFPDGVYLISSPLVLRRGTRLFGTGSFDTVTGRGAQILLAPNSNCGVIKTEMAAGIGVATHYYSLENLYINGNSQFQSELNTAIEFWGAFIGSSIRNVFINNIKGSGLTLDGGCDVQINHVWINGCVVGAGNFALDTNQAITTGSLRGGLLNIDHLYVENTSIEDVSIGGQPRETVANRANAIRFARLETVNIHELHVEGASRPMVVESCRAIQCAKISAAWVGDPALGDNAVVLLQDADTRLLKFGQILITAGESAGIFAVKKIAGLSSNFLPNAEFHSGSGISPNCSGYAAHVASTNVDAMNGPCGFRSRVVVYSEGGSGAQLRLVNGQENANSALYSYMRNQGLQTRLGTTINQPSNAQKDFITFHAESNQSSDRVVLSDPVYFGIRGDVSNIAAGSFYRVSPSVGFGVGPVYQRISGQTAGADAVMTASRGAGAPTINAEYIGQVYIDTSATPRQGYLAVNFGTGAGDWRQITA